MAELEGAAHEPPAPPAPARADAGGEPARLVPPGRDADGGMGTRSTGLEGNKPYSQHFDRLRGHTPPPPPHADPSRTPSHADPHQPCRTRSELLSMRKQLYIDANEERKRAHEEANPVWAATLSAEPGPPKPTYNRTRSEMRAERRRDKVATAVLSSGEGILDRDKNIMLNADPNAVVTTISRPQAYGAQLPLTYVPQPAVPTRSALLEQRRHELVRENARTMKSIGDEGYRSFYQRVSDRLDSSLKQYYDSQETSGAKLTRGQLMEQRKADFIAENDEFVERHRQGLVREPNYADQAEPFWTLGREVPHPAITSQHELKEKIEWYRKPEVFLPGRSPREKDPFKAGEGTRLSDKLSAGPKKHQRGYPHDSRQLTGEIPWLPAPEPSALVTEHKASVKETLRFLDFKLKSEKEPVAGVDMAMELPMYSSFTRDGVFREPPRAPRHIPVQQSSQPNTPASRSFNSGGSQGGGPPRSPMLMTTLTPAKPGTSASVRSGGFQVIDTLRG